MPCAILALCIRTREPHTHVRAPRAHHVRIPAQYIPRLSLLHSILLSLFSLASECVYIYTYIHAGRRENISPWRGEAFIAAVLARRNDGSAARARQAGDGVTLRGFYTPRACARGFYMCSFCFGFMPFPSRLYSLPFRSCTCTYIPVSLPHLHSYCTLDDVSFIGSDAMFLGVSEAHR